MRRRFPRGIRVLLECEHEAVLSSSWYRLSRALVAVIVGAAARRGVFCRHESHGAVAPCCAITRVIGTERL